MVKRTLHSVVKMCDAARSRGRLPGSVGAFAAGLRKIGQSLGKLTRALQAQCGPTVAPHTLESCQNNQSSQKCGKCAEPQGLGVGKVTVVASPTRKYFSRRTGNAKRHAGSVFILFYHKAMKNVHANVVCTETQPAVVQRQQRTVH
jgi:hypothetical protein